MRHTRAALLAVGVTGLAIIAGALLVVCARAAHTSLSACVASQGTVAVRDGLTSFRIDRTEVTVGRFAAFIEATGYVTDAERDSHTARVFTGPDQPLISGWWHEDKAANWRNPDGNDHAPAECDPVVQVTLNDALAFAAWAGGALPDEAEWGTAAGETVWNRPPASRANYWQGIFPFQNSGEDGHVGRAPVASYPANENGLYDMVGNVWEMTVPSGPERQGVVIRGGSYLCAENFCRNYTPQGADLADPELATSHIGFRLVYHNADSGKERS